MNHKSFLISPLSKGFQVDTIDENGKPIKTGHTSGKNAWNSVKSKIKSTHQILITDMGEVNGH